jgi:hypothetical protein
MRQVDEEITALLLTTATHPVSQVREAAGALIGRIRADGPIGGHLDASLRRLTRDYGWEVAQEARFLVRDLKLAQRRQSADIAELARSLAHRAAGGERRVA